MRHAPLQQSSLELSIARITLSVRIFQTFSTMCAQGVTTAARVQVCAPPGSTTVAFKIRIKV